MTNPSDWLPHAAPHNPWKRPMYFIIGGLILRSAIFGFWGVEVLIPLLGTALIYCGSRLLQNRHPGFRNATYSSMTLFILELLTLLLLFIFEAFDSTIAKLEALSEALEFLFLLPSISLVVYGVGTIFLAVAVLLQLRKGVKGEYSRCGKKFSPDVFILFIACLAPTLVVSFIVGFVEEAGTAAVIESVYTFFGFLIIFSWIFGIGVLYMMLQMTKNLGEMIPHLEQPPAVQKEESKA